MTLTFFYKNNKLMRNNSTICLKFETDCHVKTDGTKIDNYSLKKK